MDQKTGNNIKGTLFICSTPIGNLEDASFRLVRILGEVGLIAAEDTRTARKLLHKYNIRGKNIISYHDFSKVSRIDYLVEKLREGLDIALVSESGTPAIQDPGFKVIKRCIEEDIPLAVIPGPNAAVSALVLSGMPTDCFLFTGFLPRSKARRKSRILELAAVPYTIIFYESPKRIGMLISELLEKFGDREASLVREISKIYEESIRGRLSDISAKIRQKKLKGEVVLVVDGYKKELIKGFTEDDIKRELMDLLKQGISKKGALKIVLSRYDIGKQKLYNIATKI
jgi:16S rRNA (cytidine1402-2'-O)-methyltransferase